MVTQDFFIEIQGLRRKYHDASKQKDPAKKQALLEEANKKAQELKDRIKQEKKEVYPYVETLIKQSKVDKNLPLSEEEKNIPLTDKVSHPEELMYKPYFDDEVYQELLLYCRVAFAFEKNGMAEDHALKLTALFTNLDEKGEVDRVTTVESALKYLEKNKSVHDACLFTIPSPMHCNFKVWRELAAKYIDQESFKKIFGQAEGIEDLIKEDLKQAQLDKRKPDRAKIRELKSKIEADYSEWRKLNRNQAERKKKQARYEELSRSLIEDKESLLQLRAGLPLDNDMDLLTLQCYQERYIAESSQSFKYILSKGLTKRDYTKFLNLDRQHAGENIPDMTIDGKTLGYERFYLKKVNVANEDEAARAGCLGKLSYCCQSLSGEAGEPCAIHGLTNPNGGFYVLCEGDVNNPSVSDPVIAQCWAWRSHTNAIVFDSIESAPLYRIMVPMIAQFYRRLGKDLCLSGHTHKVACGSNSGVSSFVGVPIMDVSEQARDYTSYSDAAEQIGIFDINKLYYFYEIDDDVRMPTHKIIEEVMASEAPLAKSIIFGEIMNFLLRNKETNPSLLAKISEMAKSANKEQEYEEYCHVLSAFIDKTMNMEEIFSFLDKDRFFVNARDKTNSTVLMYMILEEKFEAALKLIEKDADINVKTNDGITILMKAVGASKLDIVEKLIEKKADINAKDKAGITVLMKAVETQNPAIVEKLLEKGADLNAKDQEGVTALMRAMAIGNLEIVRKLVEKGADINAKDNAEITILMKAVETQMPEIVETLLEKGADFNAKDKEGVTALMRAAAIGNFEIVRKLSEKGADLNAKDNFGYTPLMHAMRNEELNLLDKLVEFGADFESRDMFGATALINAAALGKLDAVNKLLGMGANIKAVNNIGVSALIMAANRGHLELVELLLNKGGEIDQKMDVSTALTSAFISKKWNVVTKLLELGASLDVNAENTDGLPLLMIATSSGKFDMVEKLLSKGADVNAKDRSGRSALMIAAANGQLTMVNALIAKGANVNAKSDDDRTVLAFAIKTGKWDIVEKLILAGAEVGPVMSSIVEAQKVDFIEKVLATREGNKPYYFYDEDNNAKESTNKLIEGLMRTETPLSHSQLFYEILNVALKRNPSTLLDKITELAKLFNKEQEFERYSSVLSSYKNLTIGKEELISIINKDEIFVNAKDIDGNTVLRQVAGSGNLEVVLKLLEKGADINAKNDVGATALMQAASNGKLEIVEKLLEKGADIHAAGTNGRTALGWAVFKNQWAVAERLIIAGADVSSVKPALEKAGKLDLVKKAPAKVKKENNDPNKEKEVKTSTLNPSKKRPDPIVSAFQMERASESGPKDKLATAAVPLLHTDPRRR